MLTLPTPSQCQMLHGDVTHLLIPLVKGLVLDVTADLVDGLSHAYDVTIDVTYGHAQQAACLVTRLPVYLVCEPGVLHYHHIHHTHCHTSHTHTVTYTTHQQCMHLIRHTQCIHYTRLHFSIVFLMYSSIMHQINSQHKPQHTQRDY